MCRVMGVSDAILNHVIFCHQEESCWPLEEGKAVKVKFDAIFNTTAYIKCFDQLGKQDKDLKRKIELESERLKHAKENRKTAHRKRAELDDKKIELQQQEDRIKDYEKEITSLEVKLHEFEALEKEYSKKQSEVTDKRTRLEIVGKQITELRNTIKDEFRGSISEIKTYISQFKNECSEKQNQCRQLEHDWKTKEGEYSKLNSQRGGLLKEEGMFQQEESANKQRLEKLNQLMMQIVSAMKKLKNDSAEDVLSTSFSSYLERCDNGDSTSNLSYGAVLRTLTSAIKMKDSEQVRVKSDFDKEEKDLQGMIDEIRSKMAATTTEREMKKQQLQESKKTCEDITKRLRDLEGSNDALADLDDKEQTYAEQIVAIEKSGFMATCDAEIKNLSAEVKEFESKVSKVSDMINVLVRDKSKTDQIAMLNRQKTQKENESGEIMTRLEDDLSALLEEIPEEGLVTAVQAKSKTLTDELREKKTTQKNEDVNLGICNSELTRVKNELGEMETKYNEGKIQVNDVLEDKDYDTEYSELTESLEKTQLDCHYAESASFLYERYLDKLTKKDCCPLCKRDFEAEPLKQKLVKEIEGDITRMQQNVPKFKADIEDMKSRQQLVVNVKPVWDEVQRLETESIPNLKTKRTELEEKIRNLEEELEDIGHTVQVLDTDLALANKSMSDVTLYDEFKKELKRLEDQIAKLENSRDPEAKRCGTTLSEAQAEQRELKETVEKKRLDKENKEEKRSRQRDELSKLQENKNKVQKEKLRITAELQNRDAFEKQKKELEATTKELQAKINELTQSIPLQNNDLTKADKNRTSCIQRRDDSLKNMRNEKLSLEKQKDSISDLHKQTEEFEKKKGRFADLKDRLSECKKKLAECDQQKKEIIKQVDALKKEIVNQDIKQRDLQDNLSLKIKAEDVAKLQVELAEKVKILSQAENRGGSAEKREVDQKHTDLCRKCNQMKGSRTELIKTTTELESELSRPPLSTAENEYILKVAKKTVYTKARKDVRTYLKALDVAIMKFHKMKMEKINKILFEYWRRIYKGNDIDKISIKTEADEDALAATKVKATGSTRKTYNYRVVATRRGVDIDMRGRCSAGQRVLASIIIRIALAESFGARCGIIALDEPTTNLDQKNINSLASALADLAEKMRSRRNFQLIIITHDSEFTQRLSAVDTVEKYWKIDRDNDGFSQITMVPKRGYEGYA